MTNCLFFSSKTSTHSHIQYDIMILRRLQRFILRSNVQKIHSVQMINSNQSLITPHNKIKSRIEQTFYFLLYSSNSLCSKLSTYTLQNLILCVVEKMQNSCHENWCTYLLFYVLKQRIVQSLMAWGGCTKRSVLKFSSSLFFLIFFSTN